MLRFINSFTIADGGLCTKNTSWALIERPYSCAPQAVGAVYDRPGFFVQSRKKLFAKADEESIDIVERAIHDLRKLGVTIVDPGTDRKSTRLNSSHLGI